MRNINKVIVHHSASDYAYHDSIGVIEKWHKARGFKGVGYHYFIKKDGTIQKGRFENEKGAHCIGSNNDSIGVCLSGNFHNTNRPSDEQFQALKTLLNDLTYKYNITKNKIYVHNELGDTDCPGFTGPNLREALFSKEFKPDIYKEAVDLFGTDSRLIQTGQELNELLLEIFRLIDDKGMDLTNLREEIADVYIVIKQMRLIFFKDDDDWNGVKKKKLSKLRKAIDEFKK